MRVSCVWGVGMSRRSERRVWRLTREGEINGNPRVVEQRTATFATGAAAGPMRVVVSRQGRGLEHHLLMGVGDGTNAAAINLAKAVAAKLTVVEGPPDLSFGPRVSQMMYRATDPGTHSTQAGVDLAEVSAALGDVMPEGSWVSVVCRAPSRLVGESSRWARWLSERMGTGRPTHHSTAPNALVCSVWAGAGSHREADAILSTVAAALPGFDLQTRARHVSRWRAVAVLGVLAVAAVTAGVLGVLGVVPELAELGVAPWAAAAGGVAAAGAVGVGLRWLPSEESRVLRGLRRGWLPAPRVRVVPPARPAQQGDGVPRRATGGGYPLHPGAFKLGPHLPAAVVAPHSGALSGEQSSAARDVSLVMTDRIGPYLGESSGSGQPVFISAADGGYGTAVVGEPGAGKSVVARNVAGWAMLERTRPAGLPGFPGARNALVYFESKPDGAAELLATARALGDRLLPVDVADPEGFAIDLFDVPGGPGERARHFVNAMQYAFADGSIQAESFRTLHVVLTGGLVVSDDLAREVPGVEVGRSPLYYASVLMGALGDQVGVDLAAQIKAAADTVAHRGGPDPVGLVEAERALRLLYGPDVTRSARASFQKAPGNKIDQLLAIDHYFSPARRRVTWRQVLTGHKAVLVLTSQSRRGHMMDENVQQLMSSLLMFSLKHNIERHCAGWEEQGRWVSIFADELKLLAGATPDIVVWFRNQARSYGVRPVFCTQYPEQLDPQVRAAFMSFSTLIAFKQGTPSVAREVVEDFAGDGTDWSAADLLNLEPFSAFVRANVGRKRQAPFQFRSAWFGADVEGFAAAQGYDLGAGPVPAGGGVPRG